MKLKEQLLSLGLTDEDAEKVAAEVIDGNFVPKSRFNDLNEEVKGLRRSLVERDAQIDELNGKIGDADALRSTIAAHEQTIADLQLAAKTNQKVQALRDGLRELGAIDPDYIIYKKGGADGFAFSEDGTPQGLDACADEMRKNAATTHLFGGAVRYAPASGSDPRRNPFAKETFNLTEQGRLFRENPEAARQMAQAAKIES